MAKKGICSRKDDYSQWYNDIVIKAGLADHSKVRGCMIIKPYGFAIWELMKSYLDNKFKETGHQNAAFPLLIPKSFLSKEAAHVDGFAKECAVVTHYRLKTSDNGKEIIVDPEAKLEEELIIRPTSETIIWDSFKDWIQSYRDLPIKINQWANVVRWEMRTRLFLRTSEFFWQEGHTAHATKDEAIEETKKMINVYNEFIENQMAVKVLQGVKSESEKFAGAVDTYTVEGLMQDGKALQMGTSHFLGQNFAKAFDVQFQNKEKQREYVWATSWGVSTRLMGALIMSHSDDQGLVLPPNLAPIQVVMVPIYFNEEDKSSVLEKLELIKNELSTKNIRVKIDDDDQKRPGFKFAEYELKGVPIRIALGPKDLLKNQIELSRRDTSTKTQIPIDSTVETIISELSNIQNNLLEQSKLRLKENIFSVDNFEDFKTQIKKGGFIKAFWDGTTNTEEEIKKATKATIRCIPNGQPSKRGNCVYSQNPAKFEVIFAKAY